MDERARIREEASLAGTPVWGWTGTRAYASPTIRGYLARCVLIVRHTAAALLFLSGGVAAQFGDPVVVLEPLECDPGVVEVADVDADGDADLVFRLCEGTQTHLIWLPNETNTGQFSDPILIGSVDVPNAFVSFAVADLNGDAALDMVAAWSQSASGGAGEAFRFDWYENRNGGSAFTRRNLPMDYPSATIQVLDVDGDGDPDLVGDSGDDVWWMRNEDGAGSYADAFPLAEKLGANQHFLVDLDGDGDLDVVVVGWASVGSQGWIRLWPFAPESPWWPGNPLELAGQIGVDVGGRVVPIDLDGDGDQDLLVAGQGRWYENADGSGLVWRLGAVSFSGDVIPGDFEGDGDTDFAVKTWLSAPEVTFHQWYLSEPGRFVFQGPGTSVPVYFAATWVDRDCDGDLDLLAWSDIWREVIWRLFGEAGIVSGILATDADPYLLRAVQLMGACGADLLMNMESPGGNRIVLRENQIAVSTPAESVSPGPAARVGPVFPNPAGAAFWLPAVGLAPGPAHLELRDVLGRTVLFQQVDVPATGAANIRLDASGLPAGLYLYRLETVSGIFGGRVVLTGDREPG